MSEKSIPKGYLSYFEKNIQWVAPCKEDIPEGYNLVTIICNHKLKVKMGVGEVEIEKAWGSMAENVRIRLCTETTHAQWVVERRTMGTLKWEEKARWNMQETWEEWEDGQYCSPSYENCKTESHQKKCCSMTHDCECEEEKK